MICFDVEFPEVARSLALAGADLLVTISANMDPFGRDHDVFVTARALENGLPHLYVNQVGRGEAFTFAGGTMAVSADGDRLAEAGGCDPGIPGPLREKRGEAGGAEAALPGRDAWHVAGRGFPVRPLNGAAAGSEASRREDRVRDAYASRFVITCLMRV